MGNMRRIINIQAGEPVLGEPEHMIKGIKRDNNAWSATQYIIQITIIVHENID